MPAPTHEDAYQYLENAGTTYDTESIDHAFDAEKAAQASVCRVPADDATWPADLTEALLRRVLRNLSMKALPLGVQSAMAEAAVATIRIGADPEVRRLEAPWRRLTVG